MSEEAEEAEGAVGEEGGEEAADVNDLFGSEEEEDKQVDGSGPADDGGEPSGRMAAAEASDSDEEARVPVRQMDPPMELEAPLLPLPPSDRIHLVKTSNIFGIQPRPFDPATYEVEEEMQKDEPGSRHGRLPADAVIRWRVRKNADGTDVKESNARFVRWSDGSLQLLLGNEVLDVQQQDISQSSLYLFAVRSILQVRGGRRGGAGMCTHACVEAPASHAWEDQHQFFFLVLGHFIIYYFTGIKADTVLYIIDIPDILPLAPLRSTVNFYAVHHTIFHSICTVYPAYTAYPYVNKL